MTQPQIDVDIPAMVAAGQEFLSGHDQIRRQVLSLQEEVNALMATWTGQSSSQFQNAMEPFYDDANTILVNLQAIASSIDSSAKAYDRAHNSTNDQALQLGTQISQEVAGLPGF